MRAGGLALAVLLLFTACGLPGAPKRTSADVDGDRSTVARALRAADSQGVSFRMSETLTLTGGDIPQGQQLQINSQAEGVLRQGSLRMDYKIPQGKQTVEFDVVISGPTIYIKPHGSSQWKRSDAASATTLYPSLRLPLVRETALLARDVGPGSVANAGGPARRYRVTPASDQLEQLQAVALTGQAEQAFLKSAGGEVDVFLSLLGGKLARIEVHLKGTDPSNGERQKVDSTADFTSGTVAPIVAPSDSTPVPPAQILNPAG